MALGIGNMYIIYFLMSGVLLVIMHDISLSISSDPQVKLMVLVGDDSQHERRLISKGITLKKIDWNILPDIKKSERISKWCNA